MRCSRVSATCRNRGRPTSSSSSSPALATGAGSPVCLTPTSGFAGSAGMRLTVPPPPTHRGTC
jgi:hypothetical protein